MNRTIPGLSHLQVNNIFCIGRNYALHAREMGSSVPVEPMVFLKPNSAILFNGGTVRLPEQSSEVHHEVELVIAIGKTGRRIQPQEAKSHIAGLAIGIDFTARDIQSAAKKAGKPWTVSKGFDTFAPVSDFLPSESAPDPDELDISLLVNGNIVQKGNTKEMIFSVVDLICYLSTLFTLQPGDLIFTGTPEGVGPVKQGDKLTANLNRDLAILHVDIH